MLLSPVMINTDGRGRPRKAPKPGLVRLTSEAITLIKIASGYTNESITDYASRRLEEVARADVIALQAEFSTSLGKRSSSPAKAAPNAGQVVVKPKPKPKKGGKS
jgi:hypothetical protein